MGCIITAQQCNQLKSSKGKKSKHIPPPDEMHNRPFRIIHLKHPSLMIDKHGLEPDIILANDFIFKLYFIKQHNKFLSQFIQGNIP